MAAPSPLRLQGLVKRFGDVTAVDGVDLVLGAGELLGLVGPSGCGKSSLLRSIAGLLPIDAGSIRLGADLVDDGAHRLPPERRSIGLVFQEHALFPHLTVAANVEFGIRRSPGGRRRERVQEMLDLVDLGGHGQRYPHELSGGERQRVALARALAPEPALMLFDEPFASLDHNLRVQLRHDVAATLRATGTPALFVTHDQREALAIADRIAVMRAGRLVQLGSPAEVYHTPVDEFVGAFMGEASFLPIGPDGTTALGPVDLDGHDPGSAVAMVRPDDVQFAAHDAGSAEILRADYLGNAWHVRASTGTGSEVQVTMDHNRLPTIGQRGELSMTPGHRQVPVAGNGSAAATSG